MGYTHYFTQKRNFTKAEWRVICADIGTILKYAQHDCGIVLANAMGDGGTSPEIGPDKIAFNGAGDDGHETFAISRVRALESWQSKDHLGWGCTKTARKPYDAVVCAVLCYLGSVTRRDDKATGEPVTGTESHLVRSDGDGTAFLIGLDLARKALPRVANMLDIPMPVLQSDRWCAPWVNCSNLKAFEVHFCIDGKGYVLRPATGESYCFESHMALAQFLERTKLVDMGRNHVVSFGSFRENYRIEKDIWNAYGSFDKARHERIANAQKRVLAKLFPVDPACAQQPPAYVRPGEMPDNAGREFCYSIGDLLNLAGA